MRKSTANQLLFTFSLVIISLFSFSQNIITVTDCNLNGWLKQPIGSSSLGFHNDASNPPLGKGSMKFNVPAGGIFWPGDFVRFRNGQYSGTLLSSLTELSFSTYVEARDTIADIHFLVVLVDINNDGTAEHNLVFDPRYQNTGFIRSTMINQGITSENVWQNWDALRGGWFYGGTTATDPDNNGPYFTLAEYINQFPNARIRNDVAKGGPAIRLTAGGVVFKPNFFGSVDNFKIGINGNTTVYDFEFSMADAGADKNLIYGYGSNCITLNGTAAGGIGPYSYAWSPGGTSPITSTSQFCPVITTTYTLTVTDKNGCSHNDDVTVFVNDVRCGNKLDKVLVCHNGKPLCISKDAVNDHLLHGDQLGACIQPAITLAKIQAEHPSNLISTMSFTASPNPFINQIRIQYDLPSEGMVGLQLFDVYGKELKAYAFGKKPAGPHQFELERGSMPSGIYLARLIFSTPFGQQSQTKKLIILQQ